MQAKYKKSCSREYKKYKRIQEKLKEMQAKYKKSCSREYKKYKKKCKIDVHGNLKKHVHVM